MRKSRADSDRDGLGAAIVKVDERDRDGRLVHEGEFQSEFPDHQAAVETIELHLRQFESAGYDPTGDFWWGRSSPEHLTRFFIRLIK